ncbi:HET-domain-containing protein [Periconia macrospinosa]|uniref:HET-domain-containing protein n=1 Tax=Periconia macrospinosa TaxID=97972 RepID=A0A2V1E1E2_9PLEO|nr:HET-domain-containing protein [Periconia macrospinosa]
MPIHALSSLSLSRLSRRRAPSGVTASARTESPEVDNPERSEKEENASQYAEGVLAGKEYPQYPVPASPIVSDEDVTDAMLRRALVRVGTDPLRTNGILYTNVTPEERQLCDCCATVDWRASLIRNIKRSGRVDQPPDDPSLTRLSERQWEDFRLGNWGNVKLNKHRCTLCDLLYRGMKELYGPNPRNDVRMKSEEEITILCRCENSSTNPPPWPEKLLEHSEIFGKFRIKFRLEGIEVIRNFGPTGFDDLEFCVINNVTKLKGDSYSELMIKKLAMPPVSENQIDVGTLKLWVQQCRLEHSLCRPGWQGLMRVRRSKTRSYTLRVIDCSINKVIVAKGTCRYVALSYVWGQVEQYIARRQDVISVEGDPDSEVIDLQYRKLSKTVADAIYVTKEMGIRYLWVDTVCIIQDDVSEKKQTLSAMDEIYKSAVLAIVAASGTHADAGLAGIQPNSRSANACEGWLDGLQLRRCNRYDAEAMIEETPWSRRGWTYQESYFSPRKLIFANERVYYHCSESSYGEIQPSKKGCFRRPIFHSHSSTAKDLQTLRSTPTGPFTQYATHVENYNWRSLSFQEDVLAAFAGVASDIERATDKRMRLFEGLPVGFLARALCWEVKNPQQNQSSARRLRSSDKRPFLPTWTWAAWNMAVHYTHQYYFNDDEDGRSRTRNIGIQWPWLEGAEYQLVEDYSDVSKEEYDPYIYEVLRTGILTFRAKMGWLQKTDPYSAEPHTMDDGTVWDFGMKKVMSVAEVYGGKYNPEGRHFVLFLVEEDGIHFREGGAWMSEEEWQKINASVQTVRLG